MLVLNPAFAMPVCCNSLKGQLQAFHRRWNLVLYLQQHETCHRFARRQNSYNGHCATAKVLTDIQNRDEGEHNDPFIPDISINLPRILNALRPLFTALPFQVILIAFHPTRQTKLPLEPAPSDIQFSVTIGHYDI